MIHSRYGNGNRGMDRSHPEVDQRDPTPSNYFENPEKYNQEEAERQKRINEEGLEKVRKALNIEQHGTEYK